MPGGRVTHRAWGNSYLPTAAVCKYLISDTFCVSVSLSFIILVKATLLCRHVLHCEGRDGQTIPVPQMQHLEYDISYFRVVVDVIIYVNRVMFAYVIGQSLHIGRNLAHVDLHCRSQRYGILCACISHLVEGIFSSVRELVCVRGFES
jgi:hypothetical protein